MTSRVHIGIRPLPAKINCVAAEARKLIATPKFSPSDTGESSRRRDSCAGQAYWSHEDIGTFLILPAQHSTLHQCPDTIVLAC